MATAPTKKSSGSHAKKRVKADAEHKEVIRKQWSEQGEVLAKLTLWQTGGPQLYNVVKQALKDNNLDDETCSPIHTRFACERAIKKLTAEGDRAVRVLKEDTDTILFRLLKWQMIEDSLGERDWETVKEAKMQLNKNTGKVTCDNKQLEKIAQSLVDSATEMKTVSDITGIVKRLFDRQAGEKLISLKSTGGIYLVLQPQFEFLDRVDGFMRAINWRLDPWPIPAWDNRAQNLVQSAVEDHVKEALNELTEATSKLNPFSRDKELERHAEAFKKARMRVQGLASYLRDNTENLLAELETKEQEALKRITQVKKEKQDNPPPDDEIKIDALGCRTNFASGHINKFLSHKPKTLEVLVQETGLKLSRVKSHCEWWVGKGKLVKSDKGYAIKKE